MGKINLRFKLISDSDNLDIKTNGIRTNNKIVYKENDITVTLLIFDNKIEMNRVCSEYKINLIFENNKTTVSTYQVFGASKVFDLETKTKTLFISNNNIKIVYELEGNKFSYNLDMEEL